MLTLLSRFSAPCRSVVAPLFDLTSPSTIQVRTATKRGGGSTKNNRSSAGRRLGVKRFGGQLVKAGEILVRQRGTSWYPGQHVGIGKDHTLFALEPGYVRFYKQSKPRDVMNLLGKGKHVLPSSSQHSSSSRPISSTNPASGAPTVLSPPSPGPSTSAPSAVSYSTQMDVPLQTAGGTSDRIVRKERRYVGIVLDKDEQLPRDLAGRGRSRRLRVVQAQ